MWNVIRDSLKFISGLVMASGILSLAIGTLAIVMVVSNRLADMFCMGVIQ